MGNTARYPMPDTRREKFGWNLWYPCRPVLGMTIKGPINKPNGGTTMEVKVLEVRDEGTLMPVICIRPVAVNPQQGYLLRRDGYTATNEEHCIIVIKPQCRGVSYDPYDWDAMRGRTMGHAHHYIEQHWAELRDGDVIDVQFILGETKTKKISSALVEAAKEEC